MRLSIILSTVVLALSIVRPPLQAAENWGWQHVSYSIPQAASSRAFAHRQHDLFQYFLTTSLHGAGRETFLKITQKTRNNIQWRNKQGFNVYQDAFARSWPFMERVDLQGMPDIILLIPYIESLWHGNKGTKAGDYGYWQLVRSVVEEIQGLHYVPAEIRHTNPDQLRADPLLSTRVAQIHLRRYYFYFAKVAKFSEGDAWLFTITAYNWGAGNVKRMLAEMEEQGIPRDFANFYHYLYTAAQRNPKDHSLQTALEYLPSLWNIAQLIAAS